VQPDGTFIGDPDGLETLKARSMSAMLPKIKAELSILNSILELKDFKSLPKHVSDVYNFGARLTRGLFKKGNASAKLSGYFKRIRASFNKNLGPTAREATHTAADGYLQVQFNILPLLSDIVGIADALARVERRVNDLVSRQGGRQIHHFGYNWQEPDITPTDYGPISVNQGQFSGLQAFPDLPYLTNNAGVLWVNRQAINDTTTFHAELEFNYSFTRYQREHAHMLGLLDSLGVNLNPAIIWNAIPWSFVVDWVVGVNRWLDDRKVLNLEPAVNISRYLWSIRRKRFVYTELREQGNTPLYGIPNPGAKLPVLTEIAYKREVGLPDKSSLTTSGLSSKEVSLGAALVIARRRRPRHFRG
jgi:hypothetical protein